jgi:spore coat polysaccharide biosynthesis predicted glycosyltransferase SpsG/GNAT superfamily N-acetyltransferase
MRVLIRCDGGGSLGVGHVMRSLALAEAAVAAGHDVVVAGHLEGSFLQAQIDAAPVEVVRLPVRMADGDLQPFADLVRSLRPEVVHVDAYETAPQLWQIVASTGVGAVFSNMEDGAFGRRPADVVIDPTFGAELSARPEDGTTWLLRGSRYTPVRRGVIAARHPLAPAAKAARSVLVVMGGTDPVGLAPVAVGLLARTGLALEVTVIAVGENAGRARSAAQGSRLSLSVLAPVDDLAAMMSAQDLVISAAGTSVWELCCLGVPAAVVWAVENQREGYGRVVAAGAAVGLGGPEVGWSGTCGDERAVDLLTAALTDPQVRDDLARAGRRVVDGLGAWRVVRMWEQSQAVRSLPAIEVADLVARAATPKDSRLLWLWRNDPATRAGSRSPAEVTWDDHVRWLTTSLTRSDRVLLLVEDRQGPVGTVRWDLVREPEEDLGAGREWEVSITVAPGRRGQSLARPLLRAAELALSGTVSGGSTGDTAEATWSGGTPVRAYLAVVHMDNLPSMRLFQTSAYVPDLPPDPQGFMRFRKVAQVT